MQKRDWKKAMKHCEGIQQMVPKLFPTCSSKRFGLASKFVDKWGQLKGARKPGRSCGTPIRRIERFWGSGGKGVPRVSLKTKREASAHFIFLLALTQWDPRVHFRTWFVRVVNVYILTGLVSSICQSSTHNSNKDASIHERGISPCIWQWVRALYVHIVKLEKSKLHQVSFPSFRS